LIKNQAKDKREKLFLSPETPLKMDSKDCKLTLANAEVHEYMENESKQKKIITSKAYIQNKYSLQVIREKLCHVIHHHYFQIVVCVLVLLDTAVVVTEIMLETSNNTEGHPNPDVELAESVLHYTSLSILSFFMLEIIVKIFAMGLSILKHKLEIFDAVIVTVSFFLDLFLSPGGIKDGIEFLVLLRLWRITRIINDAGTTQLQTITLIAREDFTVQWVTNNVATHHK